VVDILAAGFPQIGQASDPSGKGMNSSSTGKWA
jgi:hypothetical protein